MKRLSIFQISLAISMLLVPSFVFAASDCSGPWQVLRNRGGQAPCRALGLDSNRGTCRPGDAFETLCDDAKNGRYRTCQGPRRCNNNQPINAGGPSDCTRWDYDHNRPCPPGTMNKDCRGGCGPIQQNNNNCQGWDYNYNQPCPPGFINRDCQGGCER